MPEVHTDQKYIDGLVSNNSFIIQTIYDKFAPKVIHYICQNNGDVERAQDVIQEVLITLYRQATEKGLQLSCPFDAYFFLLCKRKWLNELKKKSSHWVTIEDEKVSISDDTEQLVEESELYAQKLSLFEKAFEAIGAGCKELLQAAFQLDSLEEVAAKLGMTYGYVRKRKSLCISKLIQITKNSPEFKHLKNHWE